MSEQAAEYNCPVSATLRLIGGKYKALILWHLMDGAVLRFSQLRRLVPQATPKMLTQQLRELEEDGLISRTVYPVVPPKVEYALTAKGNSLGFLLEGMYDWGERQMQEAGVEPNCTMVEHHNACGRKCNVLTVVQPPHAMD